MQFTIMPYVLNNKRNIKGPEGKSLKINMKPNHEVATLLVTIKVLKYSR